MLSKPISDCGCGGGLDCITKHRKQFKKWVRAELQRLDCGCGCKGKNKFEEKYGELVGGKLKDCPPGWRNDGLTCVENCNPDERDDGLTCRKKCEPGWVDDGLTCRKPITSSIDPCPDGSQDVAGTCWGTVRQDCIDDCFKHPAPGCKTYECGRLKGAFGEDWGPKLCTDCNLRCGQTCWDVKGITKQLHERNLRLSGGEVILQAIRGKRIQGRVDWEATFAEIESGMKDVFGNDSGLAMLFDPNKNGVNEAFRKFGEDTKAVFEEVGRKTKDAFDKMGADAKAAFEKFAKDAEGNLTGLLGKEFMDKMKDPKFWIEAAAIFAQVGATVLGVLVTAGTLGLGAAAGAALIMAANMAGPAIRMIGKAAMGEPIDALDIADMALSAIPAPGPGKAASSLIGKAVQTVVRNGATIKAVGGLVISGVKAGQALGMIPSSCIGPNCPAPPNPPGPPPKPDERAPPPMPPSDDPPPPGQLSEKEIAALQPEDTVRNKIKVDGVKIVNPKYMSLTNWIKKYRFENYGTPYTDAAGNIITEEQQRIQELTSTTAPQPPVEPPNPITIEGDEIEPFVVPGGDDEFPFTFDDEDEEGEQVNIEGDVVETEPIPEEPPIITRPIGEPLTDDEIIELQPADTINRKIIVDGKKVDNPKYISGTKWIEQYKANLDKIPEVKTTSQLIAEGVEPVKAKEQSDAQLAKAEEEEFGKVEEFVPFGEEEVVGTEEEFVPFGEEEEVEEFKPFTFEEEDIEELPAESDSQEIEPFTLDKENSDKYVYEIPGDDCGTQRFQEDELFGSAEPSDDIEPLLDGDILENPFGSLKSQTQYAFIPKTHKGNNFVAECYAAKNPEVAKASNNDYDKLTSHWIQTGSKQALDADCGPGTSTIEERIRMLQEQEQIRLQNEAKKVNCKATDRFWIEREERCDGLRDAAGNINKEAADCRRNGNFWDDDFGFKFCNSLKNPEGKFKSGKEFCNSQGSYWNGSKCISSKNVDGSMKTPGDVCSANNVYTNLPYDIVESSPWTVCDVSKDREGRPVSEEQLCLATASLYQNGKCHTQLFPNGQPKPQNVLDEQSKYYVDRKGDYERYKTLINMYVEQSNGSEFKELQTNTRTKRKEEEERKKAAEFQQKIKDVIKLFDPVYFVNTYVQKASDILGNTLGQYNYNPATRKNEWVEKPKLTEEQKLVLQWAWITYLYAENYEGTPGIKISSNKDVGPNPEGQEYAISINKLRLDPRFNQIAAYGRKNVDAELKNLKEYLQGFVENETPKGSGKPTSLTLYWAEWCPHCHDLMPIWKKLAHKGVKIEAIEESQSNFKVDGYPTIIFRSGKKMEKYTGPRTLKAIKNFLKNKLS